MCQATWLVKNREQKSGNDHGKGVSGGLSQDRQEAAPEDPGRHDVRKCNWRDFWGLPRRAKRRGLRGCCLT